jgi:Uma2 family endonuclease
MTALPNRPLMSEEEYLELDRNSVDVRYEYYNGHVRMLAGGSIDHATIGANVISILRGLLRGSSCRVLTSDARVRLPAKLVYPDVSVSCDERDRGRIDIVQYPRLIVEVLSPSTEAFDRGQKFAYYRECTTIQEYVLIDSQRPAVEVFKRERNSFWTYHAFEPGEDVELASIDVRFPVDAVYEDINFPLDNGEISE